MASAWDFTRIWIEIAEDYPDFLTYVGVNGLNLCPYLADGQARKMVSTLSGLDHLEGQLIEVTADGRLPDPTTYTVEGGLITLSTPAAVIHAGLPYLGKLKFLPLNGDGQTPNDDKLRKMFEVSLRVWQTAGGYFGQDEDNLFPIEYVPTENALFTGDIFEVGFESSWTRDCEPVLELPEPLPFMLLAAFIRSEISEDK